MCYHPALSVWEGSDASQRCSYAVSFRCQAAYDHCGVRCCRYVPRRQPEPISISPRDPIVLTRVHHSAAPAATAAPSFSFGAKPTATPTSTTATTTTAAATPSSALTFGGAKPSASTAPAAGSTSAAVAAPTPSLLRGKTLDEIVNAWSVELDERARDFVDVAGEVREWDRVLRENGEQVRSESPVLGLSC